MSMRIYFNNELEDVNVGDEVITTTSTFDYDNVAGTFSSDLNAYADVDVFCRDNNAKEASQLIEREDYDRIVDLLNCLNDENEQLKKENYELHKRLGDFEQFEEHIKERTSKTFVKKRCNEYWEEAGLNNDYFE